MGRRESICTSCGAGSNSSRTLRGELLGRPRLVGVTHTDHAPDGSMYGSIPGNGLGMALLLQEVYQTPAGTAQATISGSKARAAWSFGLRYSPV